MASQPRCFKMANLFYGLDLIIDKEMEETVDRSVHKIGERERDVSKFAPLFFTDINHDDRAKSFSARVYA